MRCWRPAGWVMGGIVIPWLTMAVFSAVLAEDVQGPLVVSLVARPNPTNGAKYVNVEAVVDDRTTGDSRIAAVELFVDRPGLDGMGLSLRGMGGTFQTNCERILTLLATSLWNPGESHILFVHGQDAAGHWGALASLTLQITPLPAFDVRFVTDENPLILDVQGKELAYSLNRFVKSVELTIHDSSDQVVRTWNSSRKELNTFLGTSFVRWDGRNQEGQGVPVGRYRCELTVENLDGVQLTRSLFVDVVQQ